MKKIFTLIATAFVAVSASAQVQAVDLGLSVQWGDRYVGATDQKAEGGYYAYGETSTKDKYTDENYAYASASFAQHVNDIVKFTTENPGVDDTATAILKDSWRTPTQAEFTELVNNCTFTLIDQKCVEVKSNKNGNCIYLIPTGLKTAFKSSDSYIFLTTSTVNLFKGAYLPTYFSAHIIPVTDKYPNGGLDISTDPFGVFTSAADGYCILPVYGQASAIENISADAQAQPSARKYVKAGKLVIEKNGKQYNAAGALLK